MDFKYCLIVSQYYHSRHMFIVNITDNFIEKARAFAIELMSYKRGEEAQGRKNYLGDLDPDYCKEELRSRYNINDSGDIYFINSLYANRCMLEAFNYKEDSRRETVGFKRKDVLESISKHHNYDRVCEIVKKHFEIA
jgi:hypothetical protein